jgi:hypothetical protein
MDQDKEIRLILRQLKDIQAQADKILAGENSNEVIETFSKYSIELKDYMLNKIDSPEIKSYLKEIPEINYSRTKVKLWQYLILPMWWIALYNDYQAKNEALEDVQMVKGKYATLEMLVKGLVN